MLGTTNERAEHQVDPMTDLTSTEVRVHPSRGRCLHAKHAVAHGEVLFTETSLVAWQLPDNADAVLACGSCLGAVGTLTGQLAHLIRHVTPPAPSQWSVPPLIEAEAAEAFLERDPLPCTGGCGAVYCNKACRQASTAAGHDLLCEGVEISAHPPLAPPTPSAHRTAVQAFEVYSLEQWSGFFRFGADIACAIVANLRAACNVCKECNERDTPCDACLKAAKAPWEPFCRAPWWDIVDVEGGGGSWDGNVRARKECKAAAAKAHKLLQAVLAAYSTSAGSQLHLRHFQWLTLAEWGGVLGLARQNSLQVEVESPLAPLVAMLEHHFDGGIWTAGAAKKEKTLAEALDELPETPEGIIGSALFSTVACINHSCDPNCVVQFGIGKGPGAGCRVVTRRALAAGEEVSISYVEGTRRMRRGARAAALIEYAFACACHLCTAEAGWHTRLRPRLA